MSRFYQTLFFLVFINLSLAAHSHEAWWVIGIDTIAVLYMGLQFGRACKSDDRNSKAVVVVVR